MDQECKIVFIILHYGDMNITIECVKSILEMKDQNKIRILIVDNASPGGMGLKLKQYFLDNKSISVVLNKKNDGFSRGNNIGCQCAKDKWNPFFYVVTNNDIVFEQNDFVGRIFNEYQRSKFDVLGPDIFNNRLGIHQSPLPPKPDKMEINRTIYLNKFVLKHFAFCYPLMKIWFDKKRKTVGTKYDYTQSMTDVTLMGACFVFSKSYMDMREKPFYPETKFYYEEYLLKLWCENNHAKIVYQPKVQVTHREGYATDQSKKNSKERIIFRMKNICAAAIVYKNEYLKNEINQKNSGRDKGGN